MLRTNLALLLSTPVLSRGVVAPSASDRGHQPFFSNQERPRQPEGSRDVQIFLVRVRVRAFLAHRAGTPLCARPNTDTKMATEVTENTEKAEVLYLSPSVFAVTSVAIRFRIPIPGKLACFAGRLCTASGGFAVGGGGAEAMASGCSAGSDHSMSSVVSKTFSNSLLRLPAPQISTSGNCLPVRLSVMPPSSQFDRHVADLLRVAAIQAAGHAQNGRHLPHALLIARPRAGGSWRASAWDRRRDGSGPRWRSFPARSAESLPAGCAESDGNCACGAGRS